MKNKPFNQFFSLSFSRSLNLKDIFFFFGLPLPEEELSHEVFMTTQTRRTFLLSQLIKEA